MTAKKPAKKPKLDNMFRIQALLYLFDRTDKGVSGYELASEIEGIQGKRPSSGKLYPFLKELLEGGYLYEMETHLSRNKIVYNLTEKGVKLVEEIVERMKNLIDARLNVLLEICHHCGAVLYEAKIIQADEEGNERKFCCTHCLAAYNQGIHSK